MFISQKKTENTHANKVQVWCMFEQILLFKTTYKHQYPNYLMALWLSRKTGMSFITSPYSKSSLV